MVGFLILAHEILLLVFAYELRVSYIGKHGSDFNCFVEMKRFLSTSLIIVRFCCIVVFHGRPDFGKFSAAPFLSRQFIYYFVNTLCIDIKIGRDFS